MIRKLADYPPVWLLAFALLAFLAGRILPMPGLPTAGWTLAVLGLGLMAVAALTMMRAGATVDPTRQPTALVTHGVFRLSRNPIYLGDVLILAGLCLAWQPFAALILVPLFVLLIERRFIRQEEAWLRRRDAQAFDLWAARTRRWL
ncbi:isoprenylcysteine carboxylmethyltransferase family protein [Paracoccus sp. (in: a-proteobacteria)]|uniref:methyltransferase family protein n=1 Tax=Paracoccus sp. TaxID=267 RepID=UPI0026E0E9F6|nr:isoprenylcysteine carboxylmethyltransferase family protein [Paracoccus sp. (in: a-proteobacteria)]MDO5369738.1 isoprenylcysteine carboxylmethyltransferase family protein [Paracoccus sp. (in: a-proteobacteria)]